MPLEIREARTDAEVEAAGRVTVAANAEFAPADPDDPFVASWDRYLVSMADAAGRAADGSLLVAVENRRVVGTVTLYLHAGSEQWRPDDAMFRFLAVDPAVDFPEAGQADKAFDVLRQTLLDLQGDDEEVPLSGLKDQMRKRDPKWSEKDLGYAGFLQFVKAAAAKGIVSMEWDDAEGDYFLYVPD